MPSKQLQANQVRAMRSNTLTLHSSHEASLLFKSVATLIRTICLVSLLHTLGVRAMDELISHAPDFASNTKGN